MSECLGYFQTEEERGYFSMLDVGLKVTCLGLEVGSSEWFATSMRMKFRFYLNTSSLAAASYQGSIKIDVNLLKLR